MGFKKRNLKDGNCRIVSGGERAVHIFFCTIYIEKLFPPSGRKKNDNRPIILSGVFYNLMNRCNKIKMHKNSHS